MSMRQKRKKIRTFRDLVVYQKTRQAALDIKNKILPLLEEGSVLREKLQEVSLEIPRMISEAHSKKYDQPVHSLELMVEVMALANEAIVLLEQIKGIEQEEEQEQQEQREIPKTMIDKVIKEYEMSRKKILHLSRSWKKYYVKKRKSEAGRDKQKKKKSKTQIIKKQQKKIKQLEKKLEQAQKE